MLSCFHHFSSSYIYISFPFQGVICWWHFGNSEAEEVLREAVSTAAAGELRELQEGLPRRDGPKNLLSIQGQPPRSLAWLLRRERTNAGFCVCFPECKGLALAYSDFPCGCSSCSPRQFLFRGMSGDVVYWDTNSVPVMLREKLQKF